MSNTVHFPTPPPNSFNNHNILQRRLLVSGEVILHNFGTLLGSILASVGNLLFNFGVQNRSWGCPAKVPENRSSTKKRHRKQRLQNVSKMGTKWEVGVREVGWGSNFASFWHPFGTLLFHFGVQNRSWGSPAKVPENRFGKGWKKDAPRKPLKTRQGPKYAHKCGFGGHF